MKHLFGTAIVRPFRGGYTANVHGRNIALWSAWRPTREALEALLSMYPRLTVIYRTPDVADG